MFKVMIRDNMSPVAKKVLEATGKIQVVEDNDKANAEPEILSEIIREFDGLAIRSGTRVTDKILENPGKLKVIGRAGVGVDNIDIKEATRHGIVVMNAPGGNTVTTGEHAISLLLSLARNIPQATASLRGGKWEKKQLSGVEITGKVLGIIGLGHIGRVVADRAIGLRMKVIASDPFVSQDAAKKLNIELVSTDELLERSDFITLHVPKLPETENMVGSTMIGKMKPGVRIVNASRGEVVNLDDLYEAVKSGHVAGAALDVFPKEPPDYSHPVFSQPNIIFTPHLGASTGEAQNKVAEMIAEQMAAYLLNGVIINAVNFPSLPKEALEKISPYLTLAERMGSLMGQMVRKVHDITISYCGNVAHLNTRPLTHAALKGILSSFTHNPVNYVSAPEIAKDKGIEVHEVISESKDDFAGSIRLKLIGHDNGPGEIWGTIFGNKHPRIVRLGEIYMDAIPEGYMIIVQNYDKPGVIGNLGTTLGRHNINIGRFQLGRLKERALCMINIDTPPNEAVLDEIRTLPNIISVRLVHLD
jgi:D-3-phosphoglycerate dehydrogenase / 2-oxoglutarate reductase